MMDFTSIGGRPCSRAMFLAAPKRESGKGPTICLEGGAILSNKPFLITNQPPIEATGRLSAKAGAGSSEINMAIKILKRNRKYIYFLSTPHPPLPRGEAI
jgi:hypothetical protein